jgi:DNA-binding LacI/PurR family transcriptional regulator
MSRRATKRASASLAATQRPDAVFAANDMMALGCLYAFNEAGVVVPDQVALAGFDDIPLARFVHPTLTTMRVNIAELGGLAVTRLLAAIESAEHQVHAPQILAARTDRACLQHTGTFAQAPCRQFIGDGFFYLLM